MAGSKSSSLEEKGSQLRVEHYDNKSDSAEDTLLAAPPTLTEEEERKLWRKIDRRLMPILCLMYLMSFLDRGNIGNAKLQGLVTQLDLKGNEYNIALTMYFIPYCIFECPANLVLKKFRPRIWLPGITVLWGVIILTLWYPRHKLQFRIGLFFGAASMAGAFSGLLAYGISFMSGTQGLLGWSWIFILEGIATVVVGIVAFIILVDFPATAGFLTPEERATYIFDTTEYDNSTVGEEENFSSKYIIQALTDWQVWAHILVYISLIGPLYGITLFLPTIISNFGHPPAISQLLSVPPYVVATITLYVFAYFSDKLKMRSPFIYASLILCLIGFSINISNVAPGVKYFGTFLCVTGSYAGFPGVVAWLGNNLSGQYKRGVGMAVHIGIGNFSGAIASNVYRDIDKPRFIVGHGIELMFIGIGLITVPLVVLAYKRINSKREILLREAEERGEKSSPEEIRALGDRAPEFKYTL
ncbi:hypothetical protein VNI00_015081 [Paramarasmius palmivorus]|uniref:MFS general substrate transporter n=1 Tax=Paramarasmius palmivorus TaxID=297713 RepID=A0AAW0BPQ5_9AGAR